MRPVVLTIAGSDCSGGAGIQADLKTIEAGGGYAATVLTAVTAQNGAGVHRVRVLEPEIVAAQIEAVFDDLPVAAIKSGMLASAATIEVVRVALERHRVRHYVLDPVLAAESGGSLLPESCHGLLCEQLFAHATLVTPNVPEAEALSGRRIRDLDDARDAARVLLSRGARAVLVKGGHLAAAPATDLLVTASATRVYRGAYVATSHTRGTGCIYASAIATRLACGATLEDAVAAAKRSVQEAIRAGLALGSARGPADPLHARPRRVGRLHVLTPFDRLELARVAAEAGADTIQYRDKSPRGTADRVRTTRRLREAVAEYGAELVVDDRVDVAAAAGADGVHLGRTDLAVAAARRLLGDGVLIGRTANDLDEARRAAREPVDYLGVGPVFGTGSKAEPAAAVGLAGLARIVAAVDKPVIAIGNITAERVAEVLGTGAHGIAVLSAVASAADPGREVVRLREALERFAARACDGRAADRVG